MKSVGVVLICGLFILFGCGVRGLDEYNKGVEYQSAGKIDLAEQEFKLAIQKNPNLAEAHLNLGFIYLNRGWLDGTESSTRRAIDIFERTRKTFVKGAFWQQSVSVAYNNLGAVEVARGVQAELKGEKSTAKDHWEKAMESFRKAVELDASNSQAQANIERFGNIYKE